MSTSTAHSPHLTPFRVAGLSETYYQQVINRAIARPLLGAVGLPALRAAGPRLVTCWRARVNLLADQWGDDWHGRQKWRMLNCRPSLFIPSPPSTPCGVRDLCPHCWGRWAADLWRDLDVRAFPPAAAAVPADRGRLGPPRRVAPRLDGDLVTRVVSYRFRQRRRSDNTDNLAVFLRHRLARGRGDPVLRAKGVTSRRQDLDRLATAGVTGGLEVVKIGVSRRAGEFDRWTVDCHQLLVVPAGRGPAAAADPRVAEAVHGAVLVGVLATPRRGDLVKLVAHACRYPRYLMTGPPAWTVATCHARAGHRLATRFGSFYGNGS